MAAPGDTGPPLAGTGQVYPELYEQQLQDKIGRVRELFAGQRLPEVEVFRSSTSHFRMRTEFRVWLQGEDLYYVMFESNTAKGGDAGAEAAAEPAPAAAAEAGGGEGDAAEASGGAGAAAAASSAEEDGEDVEQAEAEAAAQAPPPGRKKRRSQRRHAKKRHLQALAAGGAEAAAAAAAAAARRRFTRVRIDEFPVASELICALMPLLRQELIAGNAALRDKLFQANFHTTLSKQALVTLVYHKALDDVAQEAARALRSRLLRALGPERCAGLHLVLRSRKQKVVLDQDYVVEEMGVGGRTYSYMQVEGAFSQPNGGVCQHMLNWAVDATRGSSGDLLELYCGNGNFTIPLAGNFTQVVATEVSKASVAAARHNIEANDAANIFLARMSSEEFTETWRVKGTRQRLAGLDWEALRLSTLFVDPPRAGLDAATEQLLAEFDRVVYVSCNPETLAANLRSVAATHDIARFAVFDQFPYTEHVECGALLVRKAPREEQ